MAIERAAFSWPLPAGADLSAKQYYACKLSSKAAVLCGAGEAMTAGVNLGTPILAEAASFGVVGIFPVICGGSVAAQDKITPDANGKFVVAYGNDCVAGIALEAGADGEVINALIIPQLRVPMNNYIAIPLTLSNISAADLVTSFTPGFAGRIKSLKYIAHVIASTAAKAATLNLEIGTTDLTGGVLALTTTNCGTKGAVVNGTAITAGNVFTATDTISVEASSVTAFVEGSGVLLIELG